MHFAVNEGKGHAMHINYYVLISSVLKLYLKFIISRNQKTNINTKLRKSIALSICRHLLVPGVQKKAYEHAGK